MRKHPFYPLLFAGFLLFASCNGNDTARKQLEQARRCYENVQYGLAKQSIDALKAQYPKDYDLQKELLHLMREIEQEEQERNVTFCDSVIPVRQAEADAMKPLFVFEKTEYDSEGRYIAQAWNPSIESGFSGIKTSVTETNDLVLTAVYRSATPIRYNRVKVSIPSGEYAETQTIPFDGGANYSFKDGNGNHYQIVTFQKGRDNGVIAFIYSYSKEKMTMEYAGGKKALTRLLSQKEKDALVGTVDFAALLKETAHLKAQKEKAGKRIQYLQSKR
ncbi:MAG: hypothetical protein LBS46_02920 [Dysgonamonadaceae bacterium]|jgi:hypothetical protein|nr:hypothetical protein [Dysgonamonadaceae bacterium]